MITLHYADSRWSLPVVPGAFIVTPQRLLAKLTVKGTISDSFFQNYPNAPEAIAPGLDGLSF